MLLVTQVHRGERNVIDDVDPAQRLVEFHTIEQLNAFLDPEDVAKVQVAVAVADAALVTPSQKNLSQVVERVPHTNQKVIDPRPHCGLVYTLIDLSEILLVPVADLIDIAPRRAGRRALGVAVDPGDAVSKRFDLANVKSTGGQPSRKQGGLIELTHLHRVFDDFTLGAIHLGVTIGRRANRNDTEIHVAADRRIERNFPLAIATPSLEGTKIDEAEIHRLFDLVGELAGQKHL